MEEYMNSLEQQLNIKYFYLKSYLFSHLSIRIMLMCFYTRYRPWLYSYQSTACMPTM